MMRAPRSAVARGLALTLGGTLALAGVVATQAAATPAAHASVMTDAGVLVAIGAETLYVAQPGDDASENPCTSIDAPCFTISAAVARAHAAIADGVVDVSVRIAAGTYAENVAIGSVAAGHSLSLVGTDAATTVIDGLGTASEPASVINVTSGTVNLSGVSITGGYSDSGGGIYNYVGTVSISRSTVSGNTAAGTTTGGGGGIHNFAGTITLLDSVVSDNVATTGYAGGIFNDTGILNIAGSTLSGNSGWYVGGIHNRGTLSITTSTLSENVATRQFGGGISNFTGTMTLTDSTLTGNSALNSTGGKGGAIYNRGTATVTNTTLSGNSAYQGGGIWTRSNLLTLSHSTMSANTQTYSRFGAIAPGGGIYADASPGAHVSHSILSESSCTQSNIVVDGGYNVSDDACFWVLGPTSIHDSTTISLAPLAANGSAGPWTMAIGATSSAHHLVPTCSGTDARGMVRPGFGAAANCDAGAYELQAIAPTVTTDPESQTVSIGADASFTAAASGMPSPTVQWQVHTGSEWVDVSGATASSLTVSSVTHAMSGFQYRAVFSNGMAPDATTAAATLTVPVGSLDHLVVAPSSATVVAGVSQAFTAEGFDAFGNALGDMTTATTFTGSTGLTCADDACASSVAGVYTVTGTHGAATGTVSLTVTGIPEVPLPANMPHASGLLDGVPANSSPGTRFTVTASGFAPHAPVTFGIYSVVQVLGHAVADGSGTAVAQLQIPAGFVGSHTVVASGMSPAMSPLYLAAPTSVTRLAATGVDAELSAYVAVGAVLVVLGSALATFAFRRRWV